MRSRRVELLRAALLAAGVAAAAGLRAQGTEGDADGAATAASAPASTASVAPDPRAARIEAAAARLRADPLLSGRHREHRLRWKEDDRRDVPGRDDSALLAWLAAFARFLSDTSRFLLWGGVAVLVVLALVSVRHVIQLRGFRRRAAAQAAVSHVRDLDVRPQSLPDDVGAAAWALWQAGQVPAALSLLYRGTLSRMIHRFEVPITGSATEGECLDLARGRLAPEALRYVTQVVRAWQASTYGGRTLSAAMGESLCTGFGARLDAPAAAQEGGA